MQGANGEQASTSASPTVANVDASDGARDLPCGDVIGRPDQLPDDYVNILDAVALPASRSAHPAARPAGDRDSLCEFVSSAGSV